MPSIKPGIGSKEEDPQMIRGIPGSQDAIAPLNNLNIHAKLRNVEISEKYKQVEKLLEKMEKKLGQLVDGTRPSFDRIEKLE